MPAFYFLFLERILPAPIVPRPPFGQISPDKNMNLRCTTAPFTAPLEPKDFVVLCQLIPEVSAFYDVSVRQLTALPPASSRHPLTGLPLLLASSYRRSDRRVDHLDVGSPTGDLHPIDSCPCRAYTIRVQRINRNRLGEKQRLGQPLTQNVRPLPAQKPKILYQIRYCIHQK